MLIILLLGALSVGGTVLAKKILKKFPPSKNKERLRARARARKKRARSKKLEKSKNYRKVLSRKSSNPTYREAHRKKTN
jgi:hypothetical protein